MSEIEDAFCLRFATDMPPLTQSDVSQFDHHADKPKGPDLFIKVLLRFSFYIYYNLLTLTEYVNNCAKVPHLLLIFLEQEEDDPRIVTLTK
jgi:hypothetical protein